MNQSSTKQYRLNDVVHMHIQMHGIDYTVTNYNAIREKYYDEQTRYQNQIKPGLSQITNRKQD
jgi:hypothetical protein